MASTIITSLTDSSSISLGRDAAPASAASASAASSASSILSTTTKPKRRRHWLPSFFLRTHYDKNRNASLGWCRSLSFSSNLDNHKKKKHTSTSPCMISSTPNLTTITYLLPCQTTVQRKKVSLQQIRRSLSTIQELSITGRSLDKRFCRSLFQKDAKQLTRLVFNNNNLLLRDKKCHHRWLFPNLSQTLEELSLSWNGIGPCGATVLADRLPHLTKLQSIRLCGNPIGAKGMEALVKNKNGLLNIEQVDLWDCHLGDEGVQVLARALKHANIKKLVLDKNGISKVGAQALAEGLQNNSSLETLHLYCNAIGDEGTEYIMSALASSSNQGLVEFSICANHIGPVGAQHIAKHLRATCLKRLYLSHNATETEGATVLAEALGKEPQPLLQELTLSSNGLSNKGATALAAGLQTNTTLSLLHLDGNPNLTRRGTSSSFLKCLEVNKTLIDLKMLDDTTHENHLLHEKLDIYLEINNLGRKHVGDVRIPDAAWPRILSRLERPCHVYMFLQSRPDLLQKHNR